MDIYAKISRTLGIIALLIAPIYFVVSLVRATPRDFIGYMIGVVFTTAIIIWNGWTGIILGEIIDTALHKGEGEIEDLRRQLADLRKRLNERDTAKG